MKTKTTHNPNNFPTKRPNKDTQLIIPFANCIAQIDRKKTSNHKHQSHQLKLF